MRTLTKKTLPAAFLTILLILTMAVLPALAAPVEKDVASGDENSYLYGGNADEVMFYTDTATGDVNGDSLPDLVIGHDQGDDDFPYFYTGKVYVYYGRTSIDPDIDLGTEADVVINGYYGSFTGNSVACGDINGDDIDDIIMGAYLDSPAGAVVAGGVAVIFGSASLPAAWDFNTTGPDLYLSSARAGELCGMSVASGDIDGDGFDDVLFGAHLGNGGVHFGDGTSWTAQGRVNQDTIYDVSLYDSTHGWAVGKYISAYDTLYKFDGSSWDAATFDTYRRDFYGVAALDATHVWAVGAGGTVIFNSNFATPSWAQQVSGVTTSLRDVAALDANNVWAVGDGGVIRKYNGTTWSGQTSGTTANLRGVSVVDANNAWAVGDSGTILYFNGTSWAAQTSGTAANLRAVSAADATHVWAVGDGGIMLYYNGSSWAFQDSTTSQTLRGVSAATASNVYAVGDSGTMLKTSNGGATWAQQLVLFSQRQNAVDAVDATHVWAVGDAATGRAYIVWGRNSGWPTPSPDYHSDPILPNKVINGVDAQDSCGFPVTTGDLNGDTKDDMVIGAFDSDGPSNSRNGCGEAYVVYGRNKGAFPYFVNLATDSDCTIIGGSVMDGLPTSFRRPLGNVNGDRYDDIIMGVMWADGPVAGREACGEMDIIYGGSLPSTIDLADTQPDIMIYGPQAGSAIGFSVDALDFNGDGLTDLATGSISAGKGQARPNCGMAWLVNGVYTWPSQVDLATQTGMLIYGGETNDAFGFCLSSANLNGDAEGHDDLVISAARGDGPGDTRPDCGDHYIFLGYDIVDPTCEITNVADGSVLAGTVGVEVDAYDYFGIDRVEFLVNGTLRYTDITAPYRWDWDTREEVEGESYSLEARAYDTNGNSASDSRLVSTNNTIPPLADSWYLAEGTTAWGFEEFVLVQNPNPGPVDVTFTFMKPGGATQTADFTLAENSRFTILVNSFVNESDVSTKVEGSGPIICERAMYYTPPGGNKRIMGHDSIGVINPSPTWYLAEGTTAWGFETYVLVQNPNPEPVDVIMTFMKPGGITQDFQFPIAGQARYTVNVNQVVNQSDVSTRVQASAPVICERAMYRYNKDLGHDSIGTPSVSREWYLAEGTTAWGFDEWVLVQNPNPQSATVGVEFMLPDGNVVPYGIVVPGQSRYTIHVNEVPGCESTDLSTFVSSNTPVICERAMYWQGATSKGGHDTIGTPMPSDYWYLAEGTTAWGFEEFVLVQNPNDSPAVVSFTFMKPDATTEFVSFSIAGKSRFSLRANDVVPNSDISTAVVSTLPVICERAMYWGNRDVGHDTIGVRGN
jgi:photosystem II stability/assembly factor-like uncharacterized protein